MYSCRSSIYLCCSDQKLKDIQQCVPQDCDCSQFLANVTHTHAWENSAIFLFSNISCFARSRKKLLRVIMASYMLYKKKTMWVSSSGLSCQEAQVTSNLFYSLLWHSDCIIQNSSYCRREIKKRPQSVRSLFMMTVILIGLDEQFSVIMNFQERFEKRRKKRHFGTY